MIFSSAYDSGHGSRYRVRLIEHMLPAVGAAYGTSKSGIGIAGLGQFKPELIMKVSSPPHTLLMHSSSPHQLRIVAHSCYHVRYYRSVRPRGLRTNCRWT